ncbi:MAG: hypothetical protein OXK79_04730 [Chloroflexota bacterium]|nr:hypothetical protein [Chloroflexota bacterium]
MSVRRPVIDRLRSLSSPPAKPHGTLAMADLMLRGATKLANGEKITCTVDRHCRTRVFDFPHSRPTEPVPHYTIYRSNSVHASLVCDLRAYFERSDSAHYGLSPPLRHEVAELCKKNDSQGEGGYPYIVVEESHSLPPMVLDRGCIALDEIGYEDGKPLPVLTGGRAGERFILAFETSDGSWQNIPREEQTVKMILAAIRASQDAHDEIRKHVDQSCLVTDDDRFVCSMAAGFSTVRLGVVRPLDANAFRETALSLGTAVARMEADQTSEHIELLVNALYWDDYKDDDFRRLHYLSLWQSLSESRKKLGYRPPSPKTKLAEDPTVVGGTFSLAALTNYRDDIAHFWTGNIDGNYLANMYRTINELLRRRYF